MGYKKFIDTLKERINSEDILLDVPMKNHTSFKIGGNADIFIEPSSVEEIIEIIKLSNKYNVPYYIIGNGSNLLISDKGIRGVVLKTFNCLNNVEVFQNIIESQSGALLSKTANLALNNGLKGLEFASGIPGTLGGAIVMNAGAYSGEMKDVIIETKYIDEDGEICKVVGDQHQFGYRTSIFQGTKKFIISSKFQLEYGDPVDIKAKMQELNQRRRDKQPLEFPSAGSVFRRPEGYYAGKLIEDSDLKGYKLGGATVSTKHCGFIVNTGEATAQDVLDLIEHIQKTVKQKFDVELKTEVKMIGER